MNIIITVVDNNSSSSFPSLLLLLLPPPYSAAYKGDYRKSNKFAKISLGLDVAAIIFWFVISCLLAHGGIYYLTEFKFLFN